MNVKPGDTVQFTHYGKPRTGTVERVAGPLVWLTDGRWLFRTSLIFNPPSKEKPMAKPLALIGPFKPRVKPVRPGMYKRETIRSGKLAWAYFDGQHWFKYSTQRRSAERKVNKGMVSILPLRWYGAAKPR